MSLLVTLHLQSRHRNLLRFALSALWRILQASAWLCAAAPGDTVTASGLVWPSKVTPLTPSRGELPLSVLLPFKVSNVVCGGAEGLSKASGQELLAGRRPQMWLLFDIILMVLFSPHLGGLNQGKVITVSKKRRSCCRWPINLRVGCL